MEILHFNPLLTKATNMCKTLQTFNLHFTISIDGKASTARTKTKFRFGDSVNTVELWNLGNFIILATRAELEILHLNPLLTEVANVHSL